MTASMSMPSALSGLNELQTKRTKLGGGHVEGVLGEWEVDMIKIYYIQPGGGGASL